MKIGIIGGGFVGKATKLLQCAEITTCIYDIQPELCNPLGTTFNDLMKCEIVFICVPTPSHPDQSCNISIVSTVVCQLKDKNYKGEIVIRSTTIPGTAQSLDVHHMPEFLTEANWNHDFKNCKDWIIGAHNDSDIFKKIITNLFDYAIVYECVSPNATIHFVTPTESECIKYFRNTFLAQKVSIFNEYYEYCKAKDISFDKVCEFVVKDARIGSSHTQVPCNGKFGYSGTCFPKDTKALAQDMSLCKVEPTMLGASLLRNENDQQK